MVDRSSIHIDFIKLANGERLLRLSEPNSGLTLEKKLDPEKPVFRQKEQLLGVFEATLSQAETMTV